MLVGLFKFRLFVYELRVDLSLTLIRLVPLDSSCHISSVASLSAGKLALTINYGPASLELLASETTIQNLASGILSFNTPAATSDWISAYTGLLPIRQVPKPALEPSNNPFIDSTGDFASEIRHVKDQMTLKTLKAKELQYCKFSPVSIFCGTWNLNGQTITQSLKPWLNSEADIFVLGFQEIDLKTEAYVMTDVTKELNVCRSIESALGNRYIKMISKKLIGMYIVMYAKSDVTPAISSLQCESVGTGLLGMLVYFSKTGKQGCSCHSFCLPQLDIHVRQLSFSRRYEHD